VHELVHLREPHHGPAFRAAEAAYPRSERAIGYLEGLAAGAGLPITDTDGGDAAEVAEDED